MTKAEKIQEVRNELWMVSATVCELLMGRHEDDRWDVSDQDKKDLVQIEALLEEARHFISEVGFRKEGG